MERTKLGPPVQFIDDAGGWHVGRMLLDSCGLPISHSTFAIVVLHDTRDIVLVSRRNIRPKVPNPPLPADDKLAKLPEA